MFLTSVRCPLLPSETCAKLSPSLEPFCFHISSVMILPSSPLALFDEVSDPTRPFFELMCFAVTQVFPPFLSFSFVWSTISVPSIFAGGSWAVPFPLCKVLVFGGDKIVPHCLYHLINTFSFVIWSLIRPCSRKPFWWRWASWSCASWKED